jgi:hypothetical protein
MQLYWHPDPLASQAVHVQVSYNMIMWDYWFWLALMLNSRWWCLIAALGEISLKYWTALLFYLKILLLCFICCHLFGYLAWKSQGFYFFFMGLKWSWQHCWCTDVRCLRSFKIGSLYIDLNMFNWILTEFQSQEDCKILKFKPNIFYICKMALW